MTPLLFLMLWIFPLWCSYSWWTPSDNSHHFHQIVLLGSWLNYLSILTKQIEAITVISVLWVSLIYLCVFLYFVIIVFRDTCFKLLSILRLLWYRCHTSSFFSLDSSVDQFQIHLTWPAVFTEPWGSRSQFWELILLACFSSLNLSYLTSCSSETSAVPPSVM